MAAPALVASSISSTSDSRPCSPAGMPGKRGARFQPMPTSSARSALETCCGDLVTNDYLCSFLVEEGRSTVAAIIRRTHSGGECDGHGQRHGSEDPPLQRFSQSWISA